MEEVERERDRLAETKRRLLDEYEEKCDKLVASMRDVEAHFESVQDDRERAERERAAREEDWRSRVRALEGELEKRAGKERAGKESWSEGALERARRTRRTLERRRKGNATNSRRRRRGWRWR